MAEKCRVARNSVDPGPSHGPDLSQVLLDTTSTRAPCDEQASGYTSSTGNKTVGIVIILVRCVHQYTDLARPGPAMVCLSVVDSLSRCDSVYVHRRHVLITTFAAGVRVKY